MNKKESAWPPQPQGAEVKTQEQKDLEAGVEAIEESAKKPVLEGGDITNKEVDKVFEGIKE